VGVRVAVPRETTPGERRVALVPDAVGRLYESGFEIAVERGAGTAAGFGDEAYSGAGAVLADDAPSALDGAAVVVRVRAPSAREAEQLPPGIVLISFLEPLTDREGVERLQRHGVIAFAMESIPRITRAQPMDALSSQATVAGYKAALLGADRVPKLFPLLMTAAGTIPPAQVLVLGAGVAGLQAIATARRLGAVVTAFDVRSAVKEQIESLGAKFFEVEGIGDAEGSGGYARELTPEEQETQRQALTVQMGKSDVIITTALVPGRPAPTLISAEAVAGMRPGSVIVDLAAEAGGNCELTRPGETFTTDGGVIIAGTVNLPSRMAQHASQLYARNVQSLIELMTGDEGKLELDFEDDVIKGACVARDGERVEY
jgi:proton-translocating NAD(P)+ transhydrogenase subunit alpha